MLSSLSDNLASNAAMQQALQQKMQMRHAALMASIAAPDATFNTLLADKQAAQDAASQPLPVATAVAKATGQSGATLVGKGGAKEGSNNGYHAGKGIPGGGLTTINIGGQKWTVAKGAAPHFQGFLQALAKEGYRLQSGGGYANRDIRGRPGVKSQHAYGRAIDINPSQNPLGSTHNNLPANVSQLAAQYGLFWGGNFNGRKDPMHFEYNGG